MPDSSQGGKVIPFARGRKKDTAKKGDPANAPAPAQPSISHMLEALHPRVRAVLVARQGKWELFERASRDPARPGILATVSLPDLLRILEKSSASASIALLVQAPPVLQAPRRREEHPSMRNQRITLSPWPGFDLALMLRKGEPRYALCLEPDTSIYIAEEALPTVASFFDESHTGDPHPKSE